MNPPRLICAGILFAGITLLGFAASDLAPVEPTVELALTVNDAASETVYRGWPLLIRGDAVLTADEGAPVVLDPSTLTLAISATAGTARPWPLRRLTEFATPPTLDPANNSFRVVWLFAADQSISLLPGDYTATLTWAGRKSQPLKFTVADAPPSLSRLDEVRQAMLQSETALLQRDVAGAMTVLQAAVAKQPESITLLVQQADVLLQQGNHREAMRTIQRALTIFRRNFPESDHPPGSIMEVQSRVIAAFMRAAADRPKVATGAAADHGAPVPETPAAPAVAPMPRPFSDAAGSSSAPAAPLPTTAPAVALTPTSSPSAGGLPNGTIASSGKLSDGEITADAAGQWAAGAIAGSQYSSPSYSAARATGAPDVPVTGDSPQAWCPAAQSGGSDWLEISFAKPVHSTEVRVRQSNCPGAIVKIEVFEPDGTSHLWWEGIDTYKPSAVRETVWFAVRVPKTAYLVAKLKITLNLSAVPGWKQIDAVQLVGSAE